MDSSKVILKFSLLLIAVLLTACTKEEREEGARLFYIPEGFPAPVYGFENNPVSREGFDLGRKLFYDPILSRDSSTSCGSCHQQFVAFAHADHRLSHGINDLLGTRNTPGLFNMAWMPEFMWDGGVNHLEIQPLAPIANPVEMDEDVTQVIFKLQRQESYRQLFKNAFGSDSITTQLMLRAMAQFMGSMISANSKYDAYRTGKGTLSSSELNGLSLFRTHCSSCHAEPLLSDFSYRNNGLDVSYAADPGRAAITFLPQDSGKFKVPSLRNVVLTYPYMHDGRYQNLNQVMDHYSSGILAGSALDPLLPAGGLQLSSQEKADILAFLNTLTDYQFISDRRFAE